VGPETFILLPEGTATTPWQLVGEVFRAYKNPGAGLHRVYECENDTGGVAVWDYYPSLSTGCEGAGHQFGSGPIGYLADAPSAANPRTVIRCDWTGGGFSHLTLNDLVVDEICTGTNGWARGGTLGYGPN